MTLFNSDNPRIAAAHRQVVETLAGIPDEYGAVFVVDDLQAELTLAVAAHHLRNEEQHQEERHNLRGAQMARRARKAQRKALRVVGMDGRRIDAA